MVTRVKWRDPATLPARSLQSISADEVLAQAESLYATAGEHEQLCLDSCVDLYFEVAARTCRFSADAPLHSRTRELHDSALGKAVSLGQHFGRLDPRCGLRLQLSAGSISVPISQHGFVWPTEDFNAIELVGDYDTSAFRRIHRSSGVGMPVVVTGASGEPRRFLAPRIIFPATLVLQDRSCDSEPGSDKDFCPSGYSIELHDPLRIDEVQVQGATRRLAKDTSAAVAYRLLGQRRSILNDFVNSASAPDESRLFSLEPFQSNKTPVVLVHGLLSDPFTWVEMVNELQATKGFSDHYQLWFFEYPTGQAFLSSATHLREQFQEAHDTLDPSGTDVAFSNAILVGHSMGGLISKLMVASSEEHLWNAVANRPFPEVLMTNTMRGRVAKAFYFKPSPYISRVVYIGTPHGGSGYAHRLVGKLGSSLVSQPEQQRLEHRSLIDCNPGVFTQEVSRRIPTSIDLLEPNSPLLAAISKLPIDRRVAMHSIIGDGSWTLGFGKSDGVVPVSSAHEQRALSERFVDEKHAKLTKNSEVVTELVCILRQHLEQKAREITEPSDLPLGLNHDEGMVRSTVESQQSPWVN